MACNDHRLSSLVYDLNQGIADEGIPLLDVERAIMNWLSPLLRVALDRVRVACFERLRLVILLMFREA